MNFIASLDNFGKLLTYNFFLKCLVMFINGLRDAMFDAIVTSLVILIREN